MLPAGLGRAGGEGSGSFREPASRRSSLGLFTLLGFAEHQPIAVMTPRMMGCLPLGIYYRPFADLDDTIAGPEANHCSCVDKLNVRPLVPVVVHVIGDLRQ